VQSETGAGYNSVSYHSEEEMKGLRPSPLYGVISITDPGRTANLPEGWGSILRLQFDDVEEPDPYKPYGDPYARSSRLPAAQDAREILQWLKANHRKLAGVYVHCWGGVSRSAAVAKFIAEKYGIPFDHSYDKYNTLVYDLLKQEDSDTRLSYKGATYRRAYADDYLYHITYVGSLPAIAAQGLRPGSGISFGKGYQGHSSGKLFLAEWDGVGFWVDRLGQMAENRSDTPVQDGLIPVVVRVPDGVVSDVEEDTPGTHDSNAGAWTITQTVPPSKLEVYDGATWLPIASVDHQQLIDEAYEAAEKEMEDDEELVYLNASQFEPAFS